MSWKLNPFTGDFDFFVPGGASASNGFQTTFVIADWVLSAGRYQLDIQHNLETDLLNTYIWENSVSQVEVDRTEIINNNTIRLYVTYDPDCRFNGRIVIIKLTE